MTMTSETPIPTDTVFVPAAPEYGVLDFNAPATIGIVLYESQRTRTMLRDELVMSIGSLRAEMLALDKEARSDLLHQGEFLGGKTADLGVALRADMAAMEKSIRADMAAMEKSIRGDMAAMEKSIRGDMAAMEKSIRGDMAAMERSIRADMAAMEKSLRGDIRTLLTVTITLHGVALAAMAAMLKFL